MNCKTFVSKLKTERFGIISAPSDRFGDLVVDLVNLQQQCKHIGPIVILDGRYDGVDERSALVFGASAGILHCKGGFYRQESIFHSDFGLVFIDRDKVWFDEESTNDVVRRTGNDRIEMVDTSFLLGQSDENNVSLARLKDGQVLFALGLDF